MSFTISAADVPGRDYQNGSKKYKKHPGWIFYQTIVEQVAVSDITTNQDRHKAVQIVLTAVENNGGRFLNVACNGYLEQTKLWGKVYLAIKTARLRQGMRWVERSSISTRSSVVVVTTPSVVTSISPDNSQATSDKRPFARLDSKESILGPLDAESRTCSQQLDSPNLLPSISGPSDAESISDMQGPESVSPERAPSSVSALSDDELNYQTMRGTGSVASVEDSSVSKNAEDALFNLLNLDPENADDRAELEQEEDGRWASVTLLFDIHPNAFCRKYVFIKLWKVAIHPLGMLLVLKAPEKLVKKIFYCCREAANDAFAIGCSCGADLAALKWIYRKSPKAIRYQDAETKNLPLHEACFVHNKKSLRLVQFLYLAYPEALVATNDDGETPLHLACDRSSREVVKYLVEHASPKYSGGAAGQRDNEGVLPLALAMKNEKLKDDTEILCMLVRAYPDAVDATDISGKETIDNANARRLMMHMAAELGSPSPKRRKVDEEY